MTHDLIIIGAGPGGYEVAVKAANGGLSVLIVESKSVGGTCLNEGCIPTKCLCKNANVLDEMKKCSTYGIHVENLQFNLSEAIERKNKIVQQLTNGILSLLKNPNITFIQGTAKFIDEYSIEVNGNKYSASHTIIATGSITKIPPIPGAHLEGVITSTELLNVQSIPQKLVIIGGGVIGLEFASIFNSFGTEVTVIEYCKEILPSFDQDIAKRLRMALKKRGITFKTNSKVNAIHKEEGQLIVEYIEKDKTCHKESDLVLLSVGRVANIHSLNLDDIQLDYTPKGILVNENMQTNIPHIYAVGDINGICQLAHAATFQSYRALHHIMGVSDNIKFDIMPAAVFTHPELSTVGFTEEKAISQNIPYTTHKCFYRTNGKALTMDAEDGIIKILTDNENKIIGCHILGEHAADIIHEVVQLMQNSGSLNDLKQTIHAHPSLSEILASCND